MKNLFTSLTICLFIFAASSCKKDDSNGSKTDVQLIKITSWNPTSGAESPSVEFTYENDGKLKTVTDYARIALTASYSADKVVSLTGKNSSGGVASYTLEYSATGQLAKVIRVDMNPTNSGDTKTFTYDAAGKVSRIITQPTRTGSTADETTYIWKGDNIASAVFKGSQGNYTMTYVNYDDKLNPWSLGGGIAAIIQGSPQSKNNCTESKYDNTGVVGTQKSIYTYHSSGYAASENNGSGEGVKYYYSK